MYTIELNLYGTWEDKKNLDTKTKRIGELVGQRGNTASLFGVFHQRLIPHLAAILSQRIQF
jgi:hypothetical protein